ncbi:MAG: organomercurial lyase [Vulcanimicrobiaceae bacterium]
MSENAFLPPDLEQVSAPQLLERIVSPRPTRYRLQTECGKTLYVYCAPDALYYTHLTRERIELNAEPPGGRAFSVEVSLWSVHPRRGRMSWPKPGAAQELLIAAASLLRETATVPASALCAWLHCFESAEEFAVWHRALPASVAAYLTSISLEEAWCSAEDTVAELQIAGVHAGCC